MISAADLDPATLTAIEDAALVESFDPAALAGSDPSTASKILGQLAGLSDEVATADVLAWRLRSDARQTLLTTLAGSSRFDAAMKRHAGSKDGFTGYLVRALCGQPLKRFPASLAERETAILAYEVATVSLSGVDVREDELRAARDDLASLRAQSALGVERERSDAILSGPLIGRKAERATLIGYIDDGTPEPRFALPASATPQLPLRPFLMTGAGGSGKSALLADIVRERREPGNEQPVVLLDFDRPANCRGGIAEWYAELTRQLGMGNAELTQRLRQLRHQAQQKVPNASTTDSPIGGHLFADEIIKGLTPALVERQATGQTLLVVLDTFEEVLTRSDLTMPDSLFSDVLRWAAQLANIRDYANPDVMAFGAVRVVVSGRVAPDLGDKLGDWFCGKREIGELDPAAARRFLKQRDKGKLLDEETIKRAVKVVGGHPLSLILFERFVRQQPDAVEEVLEQGDVSRMMSSEDAARSLYSRFLLRLNVEQRGGQPIDPEKVRRIAHPGLVLREVTAEHVADIIAPGCDVSLAPGEAEALFNSLTEQVWLVETVPGRTPRTVRHRADVRRLMLPMMSGPARADPNAETTAEADLAHEVENVRRRAVEWFASRSKEPLDEYAVEAAYHRAFLGEIEDISDASLWKQVWNLSPDDVAAMPPSSAALIRYYGRGASSLSREQTEMLPAGLRRRAAVKQTTESIAAGRIDEAAASAELVEPSGSASEAEPPVGDQGASPTAQTPPQSLYALARDQALAAGVNSAFLGGFYPVASVTGWMAILGRADTPLGERLPIEEDVASHWIWRSALARMGHPGGGPSEAELNAQIESLLSFEAARGYALNSAGLVLAAACYVASVGRCEIPPEGAEVLATLASQAKYLSTPGDARLLTLATIASGRALEAGVRIEPQLSPVGADSSGWLRFPALPRDRLFPGADAMRAGSPRWGDNAFGLLNARLPELQPLVLAIAAPLVRTDSQRLLRAVRQIRPALGDRPPEELDDDYLAKRFGDALGSDLAFTSVFAAADVHGVMPHLVGELFRSGEAGTALANLCELINTYCWLLGAEFD